MMVMMIYFIRCHITYVQSTLHYISINQGEFNTAINSTSNDDDGDLFLYSVTAHVLRVLQYI